jgi:hypothetical protein
VKPDAARAGDCTKATALGGGKIALLVSLFGLAEKCVHLFGQSLLPAITEGCGKRAGEKQETNSHIQLIGRERASL